METRGKKQKGRYAVSRPDGSRHGGIFDLESAKKEADEVTGSMVYEKGRGIVYTSYPPIKESLTVRFLRALIKLRESVRLAHGR